MPAPALRVIHPGTFSTVQDLGRPRARTFGVPSGGAFDLASFRLANALVGNPRHAAALELTLFGGLYEAECPLALALSGASMSAQIESPDGLTRHLEHPRSFRLEPGERLRLGGVGRGARTYLVVRGGIQTNVLLGSRSTETPILAGALLPVLPGSCPTRWPRPGSVEPPHSPPIDAPLRVIAGPDASSLPFGWEHEAAFRVGPLSDRVGIRLLGPSCTVRNHQNAQRRSAPVAFGAIQSTPNGLIILGPACGTMGGYPHVAHVISADLDRLAQLRSGDPVRFSYLDLAIARRLDQARLKFLSRRDARIALIP